MEYLLQSSELTAYEYYASKIHTYTINKDKPAVKRLEHLRAWKGVLEEIVKDANRALAARRKNVSLLVGVPDVRLTVSACSALKAREESPKRPAKRSGPF